VSGTEYERRVNRVIDYIQAHRAEPLSLDVLAAVAAFSPYHFHRIWKAMTGETVGAFVQRIRLEAAASNLLLKPHADILAIALDSGFNSASAFARAFKERFGVSASGWRAGAYRRWRKAGEGERNPGEAEGSPCKAPGWARPHDASGSSVSTDTEDIMNRAITIQTLATYRIAYFRNVGPYGPGGGVASTWQRLVTWATARDLWKPDRICVGIAHDDPNVTEPARCRWDAGISLPDGFRPDESVNVATVQGGKVATARFHGTALEIARAWHDLYAWLPGSGYQPDDRPCIEVYRGEAVDTKTGVVTCDLCLAIKPL
jgi:AraC family transcriptional regulator